MYITKDKNREYVIRFWNGEPSGVLLWKLMAPWSDSLREIAGQQGYDSGDPIMSNLDFFSNELGCVTHGIFKAVKTENKNMREIERQEADLLIHEYHTPHGVLTEKLRGDQVIEHKVKTQEDLKAYIAILHDTEVLPEFNAYQKKYNLYSESMPIIVEPDTASAAQQFLQYDIGIVNFWYFAQDCPALLEECMGVFQALMSEKYRLMQQVDSDGFYQGENTSTTMISPQYYQQYGLPQVKQFVDAAHSNGKRAMVHMCGLLYDLMPLIKETGMDGIHSLTPAPIGNTSFGYAYSVMPSNTSIMGRFGAGEWIGKSKAKILNNLAKTVPHRIYQEYPFVLIATSDLEQFDTDDLLNLRDAIEEYEKKA